MLRSMFLSTLAATTLALSVARAEELGPIEGRLVYPGAVSGVVDFVPRGANDQLVAPLTAGEEATPARFETSHAAGQSVVAAIAGHLAFYPDRVDAIEELPR